MDWGAIGAIATITAVAVALLQLRSGKKLSIIQEKSNILKYRLVKSSGDISEAFGDKYSWKTMHVKAYEVCNISNHTIENIILRVDHGDKLLWCNANVQGKLSDSAIVIEQGELSSLLRIPFLREKDRLLISTAVIGLGMRDGITSEVSHVEVEEDYS